MNKTEIIDLCDAETPVCDAPEPFPLFEDQGVGLRTAAGNPLVCGGAYLETDCYEYKSDQRLWVEGPSLRNSRVDATSVELPNGTFWIMSSYSGDEQYTTELYQDGTFIDGPDLPNYGHVGYPCSTQLSETQTFYGNEFGFIDDHISNTFEETPNHMPNSAYGAACGAATTADGTRILIVAGGYGSTDFKSVLMYVAGQW